MHTDAGRAGARMKRKNFYPCVSVSQQYSFFSQPGHARRIAISMLGRMMEAVR